MADINSDYLNRPDQINYFHVHHFLRASALMMQIITIRVGLADANVIV
jgi:hypothetical protein